MMDENKPIRERLVDEHRAAALAILRMMCLDNLPAMIDGDQWPPGYVDGWNDCLSLVMEELGIGAQTYTITDKGRKLLEKSNG